MSTGGDFSIVFAYFDVKLVNNLSEGSISPTTILIYLILFTTEARKDFTEVDAGTNDGVKLFNPARMTWSDGTVGFLAAAADLSAPSKR